MRQATVIANEPLADRFHLITLAGPALKGVAWLPGQKVQIAIGSGLATRTYTPIDWNPSTGHMRILGYAHGDGPGSAWVRSVACGDACDLFGPRPSLDLSRLPGPLVILGDETSIGLAHAAVAQDPARRVQSCFEVEDRDSARQVTSRLNLPNATLVTRGQNDAHIPALAATARAGDANGAAFVITGKAATIQRLRRILRQQSVPAAAIVTKAYWAPGKTGLD